MIDWCISTSVNFIYLLPLLFHYCYFYVFIIKNTIICFWSTIRSLLIVAKRLIIFSFTLLVCLFIDSGMWLINQSYQSCKAFFSLMRYFLSLLPFKLFFSVGTCLDVGLGLSVSEVVRFALGLGISVVIKTCKFF